MVDLDASRFLLGLIVRLGDGLSDDSKTSRLWHGGGDLVGCLASGDANKSGIHFVGDDGLDQVLEGVLGVLVVNFFNGGRLLVQRLDDGSLSGDGSGENDSSVDVGANLDGVSLDGVGALVGVGGGGRSGRLGELGSSAKSEGEEDGVGLGGGKVNGKVHVVVGEGGPVFGYLGGTIGLLFVHEFDSEFFPADLLGGFGLLSGPDQVEVFVLLGQGFGPWVLDDGGVWELRVGQDSDLSRWSTMIFQVGGSHGELDGLALASLSNDSQGQLDSDIPLVTDLVVALSVWNLGGETGLELTDGAVELI